MPETAEKLMVENISKNMSDADEYPAMVCTPSHRDVIIRSI
jgi:glutamate/tyrosine decarboxylase-like PLP-dependent enzyme